MQRRAAAAYFLFFLVISVAAYAYIGVAESQRPVVSDDLDPTATLENESTFQTGGTTYTATNIHLSTGGGGGHGGGGGGSMVGTLTWTNESARYTATLSNGSTVTRSNTTYLVTTSNATGEVTLTEQFNVSAMLRADDSVENSLAQQNGTDYVVYRENDSLEPLSEWLPEPETRTYTVGDSYDYQADGGTQSTTIVAVSDSEATLEWFAPKDREVELSEGGNVTLGGTTYFAHFPNHHTVQLVSVDQLDTYHEQLDRQDYFHERKNGLWGVSILSGIAAVLLLGMAYMPTRG